MTQTGTSEIASKLYLDSTTHTFVKSGSHVDVGKGFVFECCYVAFNLLSSTYISPLHGPKSNFSSH